MALAIDIMHEQYPSDEMHTQLQAKKTIRYVRKAVLVINKAAKEILFTYFILLKRQSMALAVNITHGCGPSNEICPQVQLKKSKIRSY